MEIKKKFYWIHFKFLLALTIMSIAVCLWGWHVSNQNDGMPFARSGAVATAILIAFLVSNYTEKLVQMQHDVATAFEKSVNKTHASTDIQGQLEENLKKLADRVQAIVRYWYATLMFFATMIWGLGDRFCALVLSDPRLGICEIAEKIIYLASQ